jgi:hypothetical protein
MKFEIKNRFTSEVMFTCELSAEMAGKEYSLQLGFAVKSAVAAGANLADANLADANLARANLADANLADANLARANLARANLARANLADANLADANLARANLARANLADANLADANLARANLARANLARANLADANLADAKNADHVIAATRILPEGQLIGWKKLQDGLIAKLSIPAEAKRSHAFGRKCRAEYVDVLSIFDGQNEVVTGNSKHDRHFTYTVDARIRPDSFDDNWQEECAPGIHFFITRLEAEAY